MGERMKCEVIVADRCHVASMPGHGMDLPFKYSRVDSSFLRLLFLCGLLLSIGACGLSAGPLSGQVLEEGTKRPIPGVTVVARWVGNVPTFAHSHTACVYVDTAMSNEEGRYRFPGWIKTSDMGPIVTGMRVEFETYKEGFGNSKELSRDETTLYLAKDSGTSAERIEFLANLSKNIGCDSKSEREPGSLALHRLLYREASGKASSGRDRILVESILYDLEKLEFGFETAEKRHLSRVRN